MNDSLKTVGLVGTGKLGSAIAQRLIERDQRVYIWNRTRDKAQDLIDLGAVWCNSPVDMTQQVDVVLSILTDAKAIDEVYFGSDGLLTGNNKNKIFVEMSTVRPESQVSLNQRILAKGARMVESPVGGTSVTALKGQLMAMVGGTLAAWLAGKNDPGFVYNGPLAGLVAVCAGSDLMHPLGSLVVGLVAGFLFVNMFTMVQNKWKIDDVLGVWPLHGLCGLWGGLAAGIFGTKALGGLGGINFTGQLIGSLLGVAVALIGGVLVYGLLKATIGIRMSPEDEYEGADLSIHKISATPD